jgi:hypothetical protein
VVRRSPEPSPAKRNERPHGDAVVSRAAGVDPGTSGVGPVYVGGLDRSGKTTMSAFLGSHPDIAIPGVGSNMWTYFFGRFGDLAEPANFERCLDAMLRYKHVRYLQPDADRIRREFRAGEPTYARLFSLFLVHFAERAGKPRWGAQTGLIERYADQLFAAYPDLRIVHMLRDPRDRYEASLAAWPDGRGRAGGATARWRYSTRLAVRHERTYPDRYLVVRFEDLVREPVATVQDVCRFLGARYVPRMMSMPEAPTLRAKLQEGAIPTSPDQLLSVEALGRFRGRIATGELAFIQRHAGALMRMYGYMPEQLDLTVGQRLRFNLVVHSDQFARMMAWRTLEELQQRWPTLAPRRPGQRMLVEPFSPPEAPVNPLDRSRPDALNSRTSPIQEGGGA